MTYLILYLPSLWVTLKPLSRSTLAVTRILPGVDLHRSHASSIVTPVLRLHRSWKIACTVPGFNLSARAFAADFLRAGAFFLAVFFLVARFFLGLARFFLAAFFFAVFFLLVAMLSPSL